MHDKTFGLQQAEDEILALAISDEALESAAGGLAEQGGGYTLAYCSGLSACPA